MQSDKKFSERHCERGDRDIPVRCYYSYSVPRLYPCLEKSVGEVLHALCTKIVISLRTRMSPAVYSQYSIGIEDWMFHVRMSEC